MSKQQCLGTMKVDSMCFPGFCFLATDHVFKCQHDILIFSLHEEDDLVRSAIKKQQFNKALVHPSESFDCGNCLLQMRDFLFLL